MGRRKTEVAVVVATRNTAAVRALLEAVGPQWARAAAIERLDAPVAELAASARAATPSRGLVVVVAQQADAEAQIAAGADEVLVEPFSAGDLERALRLAALRAGVREDRAVEARLLEQVLEGIARAVEGPLAAIALDVDTLRAASPSPFAPDDVDAALEECGAAVDHVARVLRDASVLADARVGETPEALSVSPIVDQVLRALGGGFALRAHVELHHEIDLPLARAPRRLLARVIAHAIVQALDAVPLADPPDLRRLRVSLRATAEAVAIAVEARPGLDAPPASSPVTLPVEGRLTVARDALRSFGGELTVERASDGGVRFVLFAPRVSCESERVVEPRGAGSGSAHPSRSRLLVVDRDERVLRAVARSLGDRFDVLVATSGEEALAIAREQRLDLALVDLRLPDMSSELLVHEMRRLAPTLGGRVAYVGSDGDDGSRDDGIPVLPKPVRRTALLATLEALLASMPREPSLPPRVLN